MRIGDAGWLADCVQRPNALFAVHGQQISVGGLPNVRRLKAFPWKLGLPGYLGD